MSKDEIIIGLKAGRRLRCDRKDDPLPPWLLNHPSITNSGIIQADDQYSYIEFRWNNAG